MVVVYRGWHSTPYRDQLRALDQYTGAFEERGVECIALSSDSRRRARRSREAWKLSRVRLGYGLSLDAARAWGLYISPAARVSDPKHFPEPGLFLVSPDATLYAATVQSMPFAQQRRTGRRTGRESKGLWVA